MYTYIYMYRYMYVCAARLNLFDEAVTTKANNKPQIDELVAETRNGTDEGSGWSEQCGEGFWIYTTRFEALYKQLKKKKRIKKK